MHLTCLLQHDAVSDIVIVGAGSAGLSCTCHLATSRPDLKVTIVEANVAPGGGAWLGCQLMTPMVVRRPADRKSLQIIRSSTAIAFIITTLGRVRTRDKTVEVKRAACLTNWTLVSLNHDTQSCMDPNTITAPVVISATGHDGPMGAFSAKRLVSAGLLKELGNMRDLNMNRAKPAVVNEHDGSKRMGPTFGAMMASGIKTAKEAIKILGSVQVVDGKVIAIHERGKLECD